MNAFLRAQNVKMARLTAALSYYGKECRDRNILDHGERAFRAIVGEQGD